MTTTLITGANKGLGLETARRLVATGHVVYVGSRDLDRGRRAAERLGARVVQLDVTDDASVTAAAATVEACVPASVRRRRRRRGCAHDVWRAWWAYASCGSC